MRIAPTLLNKTLSGGKRKKLYKPSKAKIVPEDIIKDQESTLLLEETKEPTQTIEKPSSRETEPL